MNILHDLDNPGPQRFERWRALLVAGQKNAITGYGIDSEGEVVNFKNGKRKGLDAKWVPAAGGKVGEA